MISRAFIESVVDETHVKVRIPRVNKIAGAVGSTPTAELAISIVCTLPGYSPRLRRGDAVIVAYEDDDEGSPVVIGTLFKKTSNSTADINIDSATFNISVELPENTSIGEVQKENIQNLVGLSDNAQLQFDNLFTTTDNLNTQLHEASTKIQEAYSVVSETSAKFEKVNKTQEYGALVLSKDAYGTKTIDELNAEVKGVEGQLYISVQ